MQADASELSRCWSRITGRSSRQSGIIDHSFAPLIAALSAVWTLMSFFRVVDTADIDLEPACVQCSPCFSEESSPRFSEGSTDLAEHQLAHICPGIIRATLNHIDMYRYRNGVKFGIGHGRPNSPHPVAKQRLNFPTYLICNMRHGIHRQDCHRAHHFTSPPQRQ